MSIISNLPSDRSSIVQNNLNNLVGDKSVSTQIRENNEDLNLRKFIIIESSEEIPEVVDGAILIVYNGSE